MRGEGKRNAKVHTEHWRGMRVVLTDHDPHSNTKSLFKLTWELAGAQPHNKMGSGDGLGVPFWAWLVRGDGGRPLLGSTWGEIGFKT